MKSPNLTMNAETISKIVFLSHTEEEERRRGVASAAEVRRRAFQICIERVGIDCCDLHDWLQAEREVQEKYKETAIGAEKKSGASMKRYFCIGMERGRSDAADPTS